MLKCSRGSWFPSSGSLTRPHTEFQSDPKPRLPSCGNKRDILCTVRSYHSVGLGCVQGMRCPLSIQNHFSIQQVRCSLKHFPEKPFSLKPKELSFHLWQPSLHNMKINSLLVCSPTGMCFAHWSIFHLLRYKFQDMFSSFINTKVKIKQKLCVPPIKHYE